MPVGGTLMTGEVCPVGFQLLTCPFVIKEDTENSNVFAQLQGNLWL